MMLKFLMFIPVSVRPAPLCQRAALFRGNNNALRNRHDDAAETPANDLDDFRKFAAPQKSIHESSDYNPKQPGRKAADKYRSGRRDERDRTYRHKNAVCTRSGSEGRDCALCPRAPDAREEPREPALEVHNEHDHAQYRDTGRREREGQDSAARHPDHPQKPLRDIQDETILKYTEKNGPKRDRRDRTPQGDEERSERATGRIIAAHQKKGDPLSGERK